MSPYPAGMKRLDSVLLLVLIAAVLAVGVVTWRADEHARAADRTLLCLERAQATAVVAQLAPEKTIDDQGRLDAMRTLGARLDTC